VIYDVIGLHLCDGQDLERAVMHHAGRVLALSRALQPGLTARALDLGAVAVIPISADAEQLLAFIRTAVEGHFHDGSAADLANQRQRDRLLGRDVGLSRRERQVLALIVAGDSNRDIAAGLHLSPNTVKSIVKSAYRKVGVTTRAQAAAWGVEHGFPTTPTPPGA
jgi:DNA-binding NarL/FixJ family response regulator